MLLIAMCAAIFLSRLPWIDAGYGADPDAHRVITAARHIARSGAYTASRFPGHPVHEYLTALVPGEPSPALSNGLTAVFSAVASFFFALILRHLHVKQYLLLTLAFALTPVVYVNSTNTLDYMFAMAFMLGSTWFVLQRRPLIAGTLLGLAIGCRITSGAMLLPLALWWFLERRDSFHGKRLLIFSATALTIGGLCFLPVVHRYGLATFTFHERAGYPSASSLFRQGVLQVWGEPAALAYFGLGCLVPFMFDDLKTSCTRPHVRHALVVSSLVIALYVAAFLRLPHEAAYLIPVVPFLLLAVGLLAPPLVVTVFAVVLCLSPFVDMGASGVTLSGPVVQDHRLRESRIRETRAITEAVARLSENSIIVAGSKFPQICQTLDGEHQGRHEYVYLIEDSETYARYVVQGWRVYFLRHVDEYNLLVHSVDLRRLGAQPLDAVDGE